MRIMLLVLLAVPAPLLAQATEVRTIREIPPMARETVKSWSAMAYDLSCSVADPAGAVSNFHLRQHGGRGYFNPKKGGNGIDRTRITFDVVLDDRGLFRGLELLDRRFWPNAYPIIAASNTKDAGTGGFDILFMKSAADTLAVRFEVERSVTHTGFCAYSTQAQEPLTEEEAREYLQ